MRRGLPFQEFVIVAFMWCAVAGILATYAAIYDYRIARERWTGDDLVRRFDVDAEHVEAIFAADAREIAAGR